MTNLTASQKRALKLISLPGASAWGHRRGYTIYVPSLPGPQENREVQVSNKTVAALILAHLAVLEYGAPGSKYPTLHRVAQ